MKFLDDLAPPLHLLSSLLSFDDPSAHVRVRTTIDAYSCKPIAREKKLFRTLDNSLLDDLSLANSFLPSPSPGHQSNSPSVSPNPNPHRSPTLGSASKHLPVPGSNALEASGAAAAAATGTSPQSPPTTFVHPSPFGPLDSRTARKTLWDLVGTLNCAFPDHDFSRVRPDEFVRAQSVSEVLAPLSNALHARSGPGIPAGFGFGDDDGMSDRSLSFSTSFPPPGELGHSPVLRPVSPLNIHDAHMGNFSLSGRTSGSPPKFLDEGTGSPSSTSSAPPHALLRRVLDPIIDLAECEAYSYSPEAECDPHADDSDNDSNADSDEADGEADNAPITYAPKDGAGGTVWKQRGSHGAMSDDGSSADSESEREWDLEVDLDDMDMDLDMEGVPVPTAANTSGSRLPRENRMKMSPSKAKRQSARKTGRNGSSHGGLIFSTNYFLVNRKMKRIVFISLWGRKLSPLASPHSAFLSGSLPAAMASASSSLLSRSLPGSNNRTFSKPSSSGGPERRKRSSSNAVEMGDAAHAATASRGAMAKARARKAPASVRITVGEGPFGRVSTSKAHVSAKA